MKDVGLPSRTPATGISACARNAPIEPMAIGTVLGAVAVATLRQWAVADRQIRSVVEATASKILERSRGLVHALGYRYRLHAPSLSGTPDLVFPRLRKIINGTGCFWHLHACGRCRIPANASTL